jgi:hypothetical protein
MWWSWGVTTNYYTVPTARRALLMELQQRLPPSRHVVQEAFSMDHGRPVFVRLPDLAADTFYVFDDITARALCDAVIELASHQNGGELTVTYPFHGELEAQQHRLQLLAPKLGGIRVLAVDPPRAAAVLAGRVNWYSIAGHPLARYRLALFEGARPMLVIARDQKPVMAGDGRYLGFFTWNPDTIGEIAEDVERLLHGAATQMGTFARLEVLHRTTQQVSRELESYSRRVELAIRRVRRRPDVLTPARLDKILGQAVAKMRELEEIPRRAMRAIQKSGR